MRLSYCRHHVPDLVLISPKRFNFDGNSDGDFEDDYYDVSPKKMDRWRFLVVGRSWIFVSLLHIHSSNADLQIVELPTHQYYVGVQFHPELKSMPDKPSALFLVL